MNSYQRKAGHIHRQFGPRIASATENSIVPPHRLAGFIGVECAYDPDTGQFGEGVPRFEDHHYRALKSVRDRGYWVDGKGRRQTAFSGVTQRDVEDASDAALKALASSHGPGQIMGWHVVHNLNCTVADLRDPKQSLRHIVDLMILTSKRYILRGDWTSVMKIWNTGKPDGKTHSSSYVGDADRIAKEYQKITGVNTQERARWSLGEPAEEIAAAAEPSPEPKPVPPPTDDIPGPNSAAAPATQITSPWPRRLLASITGSGIGFGTLWAWASTNATPIAVGIICFTVLMIVLIFRQEIRELFKMAIAANPKMENVE